MLSFISQFENVVFTIDIDAGEVSSRPRVIGGDGDGNTSIMLRRLSSRAKIQLKQTHERLHESLLIFKVLSVRFLETTVLVLRLPYQTIFDSSSDAGFERLACTRITGPPLVI